jgi:large subunit ribosomal protein L4
MAEATIFRQSGESAGQVPLKESVFGVTPHAGAMHEAVRLYLDNQRQGTASALTRAEVKASGRKPWRQKGTGRARAGMRSSPIWRAGGIIFGPKPRSYKRTLPRKLRRLAVRSALSARAAEGAVLVLESLDLPEVKTRRMAEVIAKLSLDKEKTLIVLPSYDEAIYRAAGNLPRVQVHVARELSTYHILNSTRVVVLKDALPILEELGQ